MDVVNQDSDPHGLHDLSRDDVWTEVLSLIRSGRVRGVLLGPPCCTFSAARNGPPGPRPLRSHQHPFGLPKTQLTPKEVEDVRLGSYFAVKSAEAFALAVDHQVPVLLENPRPVPGVVSMFDLPPFQALFGRDGVQVNEFDQCRFGADSAKPTRFMSGGLPADGFVGWCDHPPRWHTWTSFGGRTHRGFRRHPPLHGRRRENGEYATRAAAAYPEPLNLALARAFAPAMVPQAPPTPASP